MDQRANALEALRSRTENWLRGRFPKESSAAIADAVAEAIVVAWTRPPRPDDQLGGLLKRIAWCLARRTWRRRVDQAELLCGLALQQWVDPHARLEARATLCRLDGMVDEAARRHGGSNRRALAAAVRDRMTDMTDTDAGRRHAVRRETVNRTRRWMIAQV